MTEAEKIGLLANLNRVKAQDVIHLGLFDSTDWRGVYELYLNAYGDEHLARKAQTKAAEQFVDRRISEYEAKHPQRKS